MRPTVIVAVLALPACSIPGIAPEGRDARITHQEIPATPTEVQDRAVQILTRKGYTIRSSSPAQFVLAEKTLDDGRINVIETRASGTNATRLELHGWTEVPSPLGRRKAAQYDPTLAQDLLDLSRDLSCPAAQWPRCP